MKFITPDNYEFIVGGAVVHKNNPVNLAMVRKLFLETMSFDGMLFPTVAFDGVGQSWAFYDETERDVFLDTILAPAPHGD